MEPVRSRFRALALALFALAGSGCAAIRASEVPRDEEWIVLAKSCRLPIWMQWYTRFAHHTWLDLKRGSEDAWVRIEVEGRGTGGNIKPLRADKARADVRWDREVVLHNILVGPAAQRISERIEAAVERHGPRYTTHYDAYPGPNSNTFLRELAEEIPELAFTFDHNALGKDYATWASIGLANSRTGVHFDTWPFGFALAAREGLELHVLQFVFGVQFWPPALQIPFLPQVP